MAHVSFKHLTSFQGIYDGHLELLLGVSDNKSYIILQGSRSFSAILEGYGGLHFALCLRVQGLGY